MIAGQLLSYLLCIKYFLLAKSKQEIETKTSCMLAGQRTGELKYYKISFCDEKGEKAVVSGEIFQ